MKLFPYQQIGREKLRTTKRMLLADDAGLGKTAQLIAAASDLSKEKLLDILVIATKSICINWKREIQKWHGVGRYVVINHDKLIAKGNKRYALKWDIIICDESHLYLKTEGTLRHKVLSRLFQHAGYIWLSTATPGSVSALDYYVLLKILRPDLYSKWSEKAFASRYCHEEVRYLTVKLKDGGQKQIKKYDYIGFRNTDELKRALKPVVLKRKTEEVKKDLPKLMLTDFYCDVSHTSLESFTVEEALEIERRVLKGEDISPTYQSRLKVNALLKIPALLELLDTYPVTTGVVVFAWNRSVVKKVCEEIRNRGDRTVDYISGEIVNETLRQKKIDDFQKGVLDVLVINMQSGGVGVNLTRATKGIYIQFPGSAAHWVQSQKRIHRIGSTKPVQIVKLIVKDSIDERIFSVLQKRLDGIERIGV